VESGRQPLSDAAILVRRGCTFRSLYLLTPSDIDGIGARAVQSCTPLFDSVRRGIGINSNGEDVTDDRKDLAYWRTARHPKSAR